MLEWSVRKESCKPPPKKRRLREKAAAKYGICLKLLDDIGTLSSEYGGADARKAQGISRDLKTRRQIPPGDGDQGNHQANGSEVCGQNEDLRLITKEDLLKDFQM